MDSLAKMGELVKATEFIGQSSGLFISFFYTSEENIKLEEALLSDDHMNATSLRNKY